MKREPNIMNEMSNANTSHREPGTELPAVVTASPLSKESPNAFSAFQVYLDLGPNRSLGDCARQASVPLSTIKNWSRRFQWHQRVQAHNNEVMKHRVAVETAVQTQAAVDWCQRVAEFRELEWQVGLDLMAAARSLLERLRTVKPDKVSMTDIARALEVASKIGRMAADITPVRDERIGVAGRALTIEITAALDKIYGPKNGLANS